MAQNEIRTRIVADTTELDKTLVTLKQKIAEAMSPNQFSLSSISPWKIAADFIKDQLGGFIDGFTRANEKLANLGKTTDALAKSLESTRGEAMRLESAARAAGVSAQDYAEALERIKSGESTLEREAEQWEHIADASALAKERARGFAGLFHAAQEQIKAADEESGVAERLGAAVRKALGDNGASAGSTLLEQIEEGRREDFSTDEVLAEMGTSREKLEEAQRIGNEMGGTWGVAAAMRMNRMLTNAETIAKILNKEIYDRERLDAKERQAELERRRKEEEAEAKKAEELRKKANEALEKRLEEENKAEVQRLEQEERDAKDLYALYEKRKALVGDEAAQKDIIAELKIGRKRLTEMLKLGEELTLTPEERFRRQTDAIAKQQNEQAQAKEKAERERQQERQRAQAERDRLTERAEDLRKRADEVEGELNASWLTSAGGSLIGNGAFSLAMGQRMRDIDRAEKQAEILQELQATNKNLAEISKKLSE